MKHAQFSALLIGLCLAPLGCSVGSHDASTKMINGSLVGAGQYGSTVVYLLPNAQNRANPDARCTGVKVSPRHIVTAAHCLVNEWGLVDDNVDAPNAKLEISNFGERSTEDTSLWHSGYIKRIRSSPGYEEAVMACADAVETGQPILCKDRWDMPSELAIVEFTADLPSQWPAAKLDLAPVSVGETVSLVGYGKEIGRYTTEHKARKKFSHEVVRDWEEMKPLINEADVDSTVAAMTEVAYVTRGLMNPNADIGTTVGLMPGDSGGPVYRFGTNHVVGIHRAVYYGNDLPLFHLHSRLSSSNPSVQAATETFLRSHLPATSFVP
ncbi:MAG: S1 family peptidase [Pseudobdellovibrionaceae bacterium]|nr:S1 family peptidase [Pseudobdellovibrionaceae bacterium]